MKIARFNIQYCLRFHDDRKLKMIGKKEVLFTEDEYREALKRFLEIFDAEEDTPEAEELEHLMILMEIYEQENSA